MDYQQELTQELEMGETGVVPQGDEHAGCGCQTKSSSCGCQAKSSSCGCQGKSEKNGSKAVSFIYAVGRIEPRFPSVSIERELKQVVARMKTAGLNDRQSMHKVLSDPSNRYLIRKIRWIFSIQGLETYILNIGDPNDLDRLAESLRDNPRPTDLDVIIGLKGPIASPEICNGLQVPVVLVDQIYSFDQESLIKSIPKPKSIPEKQFASAAEELLQSLLQLVDNAGSKDEHRAVNYLAVRYAGIYALVAECYERNYSISSVEVRPSRLSGTRTIMDVVFSFTHRTTDVTEKHFVRVDVTEEFPFLVSKLAPFYDR